MRRIVHHHAGEPAAVLDLIDVPPPIAGAGHVLVRVTYAPIHPGDLLGIEGSPAFGPPPPIKSEGRGPGFEGAGVVVAVDTDHDPAAAVGIGDRVIFFPASEVWSDLVAVPTSSIVKLPDTIPDHVGASLLINTITAGVLVREGLKVLPAGGITRSPVIQTGAASAVGLLLTTLLLDAGLAPIRIVSSRESADRLTRLHPAVPTVARSDPDWREQLNTMLLGRKAALAYDSVGGDMIAEICSFMEMSATVLNYGSLGGQLTDIRSIVPARLTLKGVSFEQWGSEPEVVRASDLAKAVELGGLRPELFTSAGEYEPADVREAVSHVRQRGKAGTVLLRFS